MPTLGDQWWIVPLFTLALIPFGLGFVMAWCGLGYIRTQYREKMRIEGSIVVDICLYVFPIISALAAIQQGNDLKARAPKAMFMDRE